MPTKRPTKNSAPRAQPRRAASRARSGAPVRDDLRATPDLLADAKARDVFDPKDGRRTVASPPVVNTSDAPFARIVAAATTEDDQLRALEAAAQHEVALPAIASVIGEPFVATAITYSGHPRAGLSLVGVRQERRFLVGLADVVFPPGSAGARFVALYRAWLGVDEVASDPLRHHATPVVRHDVASADLAVGSPVELVVLACKSNAIRGRLLGTVREVTLRTAVRDEVPGGIITVVPTKLWTHARRAHLEGNVLSSRVDVAALGLEPLILHAQGDWDPRTQYWGEEGEPIEEWAKPIIARGKRPMFEMEQVLPGVDPEDFDSDPIVEASERNAAGDRVGARNILMNVLAEDLRCLDAHAHLGNFHFTRQPAQALRHYDMGMSIGALALGENFDGVLAWGLIDNRPFLRCMNGVGLCSWRLGKTREAAAVFRKILSLNPGDNQGARFNLAAIEAGKTWAESERDE